MYYDARAWKQGDAQSIEIQGTADRIGEFVPDSTLYGLTADHPGRHDREGEQQGQQNDPQSSRDPKK